MDESHLLLEYEITSLNQKLQSISDAIEDVPLLLDKMDGLLKKMEDLEIEHKVIKEQIHLLEIKISAVYYLGYVLSTLLPIAISIYLDIT